MVGPDVEELAASMEGRDYYGQRVAFQTENIGEPLLIEKYGLKVKRYPNCGSLHRTLDCVLALKAQYGFDASDVADVLVHLPAIHSRNLMYPNPVSPMEAKFSLEYSVAAALHHGNVTLHDYEPEQIAAPHVRDLMPLVRKQVVDKLENEFPTEVQIELKDGRRLNEQVYMHKGTAANPLSEAEIATKFRDCTQTFDAATASKLQALLFGMEELADTRQLTALLQADTSK